MIRLASKKRRTLAAAAIAVAGLEWVPGRRPDEGVRNYRAPIGALEDRVDPFSVGENEVRSRGLGANVRAGGRRIRDQGDGDRARSFRHGLHKRFLDEACHVDGGV